MGEVETLVACKHNELVLRGVLETPDCDIVNGFPIAILMHGFMSSSKSPGIQGLAKGLKERGIASLRFDFSGAGQSDGKYEEMTIRKQVSEADTILTYVKSLDCIDQTKIFLVGLSMGGVVASLLAGQRKQDINKCCLWYPAAVLTDDVKAGRIQNISFDLKNLPDYVTMPNGIRVGRAYIEEVLSLNIYEEAARFNRDVLVVHGDEDGLVPMKYSQQYCDVYERASLYVVHGGGHGFNGALLEEAVDKTVRFLSF